MRTLGSIEARISKFYAHVNNAVTDLEDLQGG